MEDLRMKYKTAAFIGLIIFAIGFAAGFAVSRKYAPSFELPVVTIQRDTVTVRDTIAGKVLPPRVDSIIRVDTVRLQINPLDDGKYKKDTTTRQSVPDTVSAPRLGQNGNVLIPISRKVYQTDYYRAVVSGWRPSLDSMEVYNKNVTITEKRTEKQTITKHPWLALTLNGGVYHDNKDAPIMIAGVGLRPTVGLGIGIVIKSW